MVVGPGQKRRAYLKITTVKRGGDMVEVLEHRQSSGY
jgi:hypothetical protein